MPRFPTLACVLLTACSNGSPDAGPVDAGCTLDGGERAICLTADAFRYRPGDVWLLATGMSPLDDPRRDIGTATIRMIRARPTVGDFVYVWRDPENHEDHEDDDHLYRLVSDDEQLFTGNCPNYCFGETRSFSRDVLLAACVGGVTSLYTFPDNDRVVYECGNSRMLMDLDGNVLPHGPPSQFGFGGSRVSVFSGRVTIGLGDGGILRPEGLPQPTDGGFVQTLATRALEDGFAAVVRPFSEGTYGAMQLWHLGFDGVATHLDDYPAAVDEVTIAGLDTELRLLTSDQYELSGRPKAWRYERGVSGSVKEIYPRNERERLVVNGFITGP